MIRYQIKIVPDSAPNADGEWIDVKDPPPGVAGSTRWLVTAEFYRPLVPPGYHMIAIQTVTGR